MAGQTSPDELDRLAGVLDQEAAHLDRVRDELRRSVEATHGRWEGRIADRFRGHTGPEHRQRHLAVARDRLRTAARLARLAADEQREHLARADRAAVSP